MGQHAPLQRRVATTTSTPARAPARAAVHPPPVAEPARSFGDLERAARAGHRLADVPTHAPSRSGQSERVRGVGSVVQRKAATGVGGGGVIQCQPDEDDEEEEKKEKPGLLSRLTSKFRGGYASVGAEHDVAASAATQAGRAAKGGVERLESTRTDDAIEAGKGIVKAGAFAGLDVAAPGLGSGMTALDEVNELRKEKNVGAASTKGAAGHAARVGVAAIPFVGPVLVAAKDIFKLGKAGLQSDKSRSKEKTDLARRMLEDGPRALAKIEEELAFHDEHGDVGDEKSKAKLTKAKRRIEEAMENARAYRQAKADKGKLSLLDSTPDSDDSDGD